MNVAVHYLLLNVLNAVSRFTQEMYRMLLGESIGLVESGVYTGLMVYVYRSFKHKVARTEGQRYYATEMV